ncbi:transposable element Tcb2 transposase [Trichonephila clavipes]|nr:transposable element Tcb2 transposase [Trichonephila clavipes]
MSYNTCRRPFSSSFGTKEKNHYCAAARCRPLSSIRKKNLRYYGAKSSSQCRSVCKKTSCVRSLNGRQRRNRLCWAREHVSWTQQQWASVLFTDESRFTMESDSGRLLIWRNSALDTINPTLLKDTVIEMVESWFGQGSRSVATLTCMCSMEEP